MQTLSLSICLFRQLLADNIAFFVPLCNLTALQQQLARGRLLVRFSFESLKRRIPTTYHQGHHSASSSHPKIASLLHSIGLDEIAPQKSESP